MAKYNSISIGSGRGSLGNVTLARYKDKKVAKQKIDPQPARKWTEEQINQQQKFALLGSFLRNMTPIIRMGYKGLDRKMSVFPLAMKHNYDLGAITGSYPLIALDWTIVQLSKGYMSMPSDTSAAAASGHKVTVSWADQAEYPDESDNDTIVVVVWNATKHKMMYKLGTRSSETCTFTHSADWASDSLQVFCFAIAADGSMQSPTLRIGEVTAQ